uniref:BHLH domain-containing protein n=7 Tax=Meloidogyne TaxID=189290 RepID=A0A6V7WGK4_MELEN|nr:unnamed protein product [Meloidogyne enterolobii]
MRNILSIFHDFKIVIITFEFRFEFNWHWIFMEDNTFSDDFDIDDSAMSPSQNNPLNDYKKQARAQHNALERRRRDNIKDMYCSLKDGIPNFSSDRASRAQILRKAYETIQAGNDELKNLSQEVKKIEEHNEHLRKQLETQTKVTR